MTDGVFYLLAGLLSEYFSGGVAPRRGASRLNGGAPYYNIYQTSDDKYLSIAATEPWFWENLCRALGREDLIPNQSARGARRQDLFRFLEQTFRSRTRDEWFELLKDQDISVGKVHTLEEAVADPQLVHRGMVVAVETEDIPGGKVSQVGIPFRLSDTPGRVRHPGPVTGEHTTQVLTNLGYPLEQVEEWRRQGVAQ
jgi:crotonobetainyl-CoA:carnitine CoA-transferase CaiB-like acyl-CoA transferase